VPIIIQSVEFDICKLRIRNRLVVGKEKVIKIRTICTFFSVLLFVTSSLIAQTPKWNGKPTEKVVVQYEKFVGTGALLTPEGWNRAEKLYVESVAFPPNGEISLMTIGGSLGEMSLNGDRAEVETKWTDYFGTIDSALRYKQPHTEVPVSMTVYQFRLVYTNKHRRIGKNGGTLKEVVGPWEWKIEQPGMSRWTTVDRALEYVTMMREKTEDPVIQRNAEKTISALKRLRTACGSSAC
jgi:hypothetical protein